MYENIRLLELDLIVDPYVNGMDDLWKCVGITNNNWYSLVVIELYFMTNFNRCNFISLNIAIIFNNVSKFKC